MKARIAFPCFLPPRLPWRRPYLNLRNHRKLLIVDGTVALTGGLNLRSVHRLLRQRGKRMQFWADILLQHPKLAREIPKDTLACIWGYRMQVPKDFYMLAGLIGLVMGGVQALSRSMYARLIPEGCAGEFFGFYNMLGKFAAILGPTLMGITSLVTGDVRLSILSIIPLFAIGAFLLLRVREGDGQTIV